MKRELIFAVLSLVIAPLLFWGCSGGGIVSVDGIPEAKISSGIGDFNEGILGIYDVVLDTDTMQISATPSHSRMAGAVGDILFELEITDFMIYPYCPDETCLMLGGVGVVNDTVSGDATPDITFDVSLKHPFTKYNPAIGPTGTNRADLDVFNPKVYILNAGNQDPLVTDSEAGKVIDTGLTNPASASTIHTVLNFVQNADGWNQLADGTPVNAVDGLTPEETVTLLTYQTPADFPNTDCHPFLNFFYGTQTDGGTDNPKAGDCRMSQGEAPEKRSVQLNIGPGEGKIQFGLAVAASYGQSAKGRPNRIPANCKYFVPAFNTHNPIITEISVIAPDIGDQTDGTITVKVRDMQADSTGLAASMAAYASQSDGGNLLPAEILDYSNITFPTITGLTMDDFLVGGNGSLVYRPQALDGIFLAPSATINGSEATGTGTASDPYIFTIPLPYAIYSPAGPYRMCFIVKDGLCDHTSGAFVDKWDFKWVQFASVN